MENLEIEGENLEIIITETAAETETQEAPAVISEAGDDPAGVEIESVVPATEPEEIATGQPQAPPTNNFRKVVREGFAATRELIAYLNAQAEEHRQQIEAIKLLAESLQTENAELKRALSRIENDKFL